MSFLPHRWNPRFGTPGMRSLDKIACAKPKKMTARDMAKRFLEYRRKLKEADQSVDTFMNRGEATTRFAYFDD